MKIYKLLLIIFLSVSFTSCSTSKNADDELRHISGMLSMTGNEPFAKLTLIADQNTTYFLEGKDELIKMLTSHQGEYADLTYNNIKDVPNGKALEIVEAQLKNAQSDTNQNKK